MIDQKNFNKHLNCLRELCEVAQSADSKAELEEYCLRLITELRLKKKKGDIQHG
ncbi:MAG: hypothetical protein LLG02_04955 [Pelosinus sp.]|nr:hypothetical protein [Pelosinus sp.]